MRKLTVVGIVVLTMALASAAAFAEVLYEDHFDSPTFGYNGVSEGWGKSDFGQAFWFPNNGFLESGNSDAIHELFMWVTGDDSWSDVAVSTGIMGFQGSGYASVLLRVADRDTYYEFRYTSGNLGQQPPADVEAGIWPADSSINPSYRILKHVNGRVTLLAEVASSQAITLPGFHAGGTHAGQVLEFKFEAVGSRLTVYVKTDDTWHRVLSTTDDELKAGKVGFAHYEYEPYFDYIKVEAVR